MFPALPGCPFPFLLYLILVLLLAAMKFLWLQQQWRHNQNNAFVISPYSYTKWSFARIEIKLATKRGSSGQGIKLKQNEEPEQAVFSGK